MRRRRSRAARIPAGLATAAVGLALLSPAPAHAAPAERPCILALVSPTHAGALARLRAELAVVGFDLRVVDSPPWPPSRDQMDVLARRESAVAALALIPEENRAATEIWVVDRVTGKTVVRVFEPPAPAHGDEIELLAVAAVETLRATLVEITLPQPVHGDLAAPPAARELVVAGGDRFSARVAAAAGVSPGGLGPSWQLAIGVTRSLAPRLRIGFEGLLSITSASISGPEGRADVRLWFAGPLIELSLTRPSTARADARVAAGVWGVLMQMSGVASAPYAGATETVDTVAPHLDVTLGWRFTRRLTVGARLSGAAATPAVTVRFPGRDAATWGRPLGLGALFVDVRLD